MNGWLNLYKPKSMSSAKLVAIVKRALKGQKVGHCGTLDVEAEGILPIAIGEATKLTSMLMDAKKTYIFTIQFGAKTDTADHAGVIIETTESFPSKAECENVCSKFIGKIKQKPPAFSALKVQGVRSYKLAREGQIVDLPEREITIYDLKMLASDEKKHTAQYITQCSKGTYVRSLAEDVALCLQSLGFVIELRRTEVGIFKQENALDISMFGDDKFENPQQGKNYHEKAYELLSANILKTETILDDILALDADISQVQKIRYGQKCQFDHCPDTDLLWVRHQGKLVAIGSILDGCFNSFRVFNL